LAAEEQRRWAVAARKWRQKNGEFHSEAAREKIRASLIIDRMQAHFEGKIELTMTQIRVGEILLRKCVPDLTAIDISGQLTHHRYVVEMPATLSEEEWTKKYSPKMLTAEPQEGPLELPSPKQIKH
jgi:hypothetical protein